MPPRRRSGWLGRSGPSPGGRSTSRLTPSHRERWPAVLARAVAALPELVELSFPLLARGGVLIAWKRGDLSADVTATTRAMDALGGGTVQTIDVSVTGLTGHRLVIITKTGATPDGYPRDPAVRRRTPW